MGDSIASVLGKANPDRSDILAMLQCNEEEAPLLYRRAAAVRDRYVGNHVYLRGLIEYSNICGKNCLYCGVRSDNVKIERYTMSREEVLEAAMTAYKLNLGSIAIQSGENSSNSIVETVEELVRSIRKMTDNRLGITLSLGEQSRETYQRWFDAGAHRYLLRIEASSEALYRRVHPDDDMHRYHRRLECLKAIQETGYQTGTGVMVGLPNQTMSDLADDLVFMRDFDIDMCGMGPFIEHSDTPLGSRGTDNLFLNERFNLTLRMIAVLRIIMKDINIVASTAMQTIDPAGREKAISCGANVVMPNLTPARYRSGYLIYEGKPGYREADESNVSGLNLDLLPGTTVELGIWGDTPHYGRRRTVR
ncbi:MAG: [FeFe] hydrogenase H-cluster radical SAM maturase HydE [Bacteroidales bacterium]|jgi:biotin synthase|nr:[FeFe] hydrogenase H-cluster radical SAM maturase HydE [Bacteroidales bacterium]MDD3736016.1 [FeFe] hydrogenase H-cluster radical SAM maturase HydE [Bacteroidales bacterium]NLD64114.1 [FeFe] hydrogenase H-cluster radical SAM maturase HydE [Bacteroidales bacterium]HOO65324.1 [FeFe] hydrogenase H-cluster radical SAM maturase HydE [Bacteroidales bacterium]HPJ04257.1 [FeFe] hydrogenase H-cluster radical SAM maturase HydE [Bacteroidales bacterium]